MFCYVFCNEICVKYKHVCIYFYEYIIGIIVAEIDFIHYSLKYFHSTMFCSSEFKVNLIIIIIIMILKHVHNLKHA